MTDVTEMLVSGLDLKLERVARQVKAIDLAEQMGVSKFYLSQLEGRHSIHPDVAAKYRQSLATFPSLARPTDTPSAA